MMMETEVEELIGNEENLTQIKLTNGETIPADICVVGIGEFADLFYKIIDLAYPKIRWHMDIGN